MKFFNWFINLFQQKQCPEVIWWSGKWYKLGCYCVKNKFHFGSHKDNMGRKWK